MNDKFIRKKKKKPLEEEVQSDKAKYSIFNMRSLKIKHAERLKIQMVQ